MTISECRKRIRIAKELIYKMVRQEYLGQFSEDEADVIITSLYRTLAIEERNVADLKKEKVVEE